MLYLWLVLPTCVGMVRCNRARSSRSGGSPHVRGDGPFFLAVAQFLPEFSPRAWGWSAGMLPVKLLDFVLPTCVGMVRTNITFGGVIGSSPHVRGDGP